MTRIDPAVRESLNELILDSAMQIDRDELELWLDGFDERARYVVLPRENRDQGLPVGLIHCESKAHIHDRVTCLRHANKFNPHYDRHILSTPKIRSIEAGIARVETNFLVVQTNKNGESKLFCAGCYEDRIRIDGSVSKFVERVVVLDSFLIPTLLATPI